VNAETFIKANAGSIESYEALLLESFSQILLQKVSIFFTDYMDVKLITIQNLCNFNGLRKLASNVLSQANDWTLHSTKKSDFSQIGGIPKASGSGLLSACHFFGYNPGA